MVNGRVVASRFRDTLSAWRAWLWPGHCLLCRARLGAGQEFCGDCRAALPWIQTACAQCATPLPAGSDSVPCGNCQQKSPRFDRAVAALHYDAPVDRLILNLKYHRRLDLAHTLAHLLVERLRHTPALPDVLVPVPLHVSRLRERGYNQSLELARAIGKKLALPVNTRIAYRVRATPTQTGLPLELRARNLRNAFRVESDLSGRHVAIVDDVMTSGHTANALAQALRRAGAERISVWVVARA